MSTPSPAKSRYLFFNGSPSSTLSAFDHGFLFGFKIVETMLGVDGKIPHASLHLHRLFTAAEEMSLKIDWHHDLLAFELNEMVAWLHRDGISRARLRVILTGGEGDGIGRPGPAMRLIYGEAAPSVKDCYALKSVVTVLPSEYGVKTLSLPKVYAALSEAFNQGFDDILLLNRKNGESEVVEASTANIFFVRRHGDLLQVVTPPLHSGAYHGLTRQRLLQLFRQVNIPFSEETIYFDTLPQFDEAFLSSSVRGLQPVARIDRMNFHTLRPTSVFHHIVRLFG